MRQLSKYNKRVQTPFLLFLLAGILLLASCDAPPPPVRTGPGPGPAAGQAPDFTLRISTAGNSASMTSRGKRP